jgi:GDSL-like Lipase/Acylhydrolase family
MNRLRVASIVVIVLAALPSIAFAQRASQVTTTPVPRDGDWMKRHEAYNQSIKNHQDAQLLFIGDSITDAWSGPGKEAWNKHFAPRKAINLGIGGDRTQHVLWRLENGNIDGVKPKAAVLMIGTNNSNRDDHTAEEIAE